MRGSSLKVSDNIKCRVVFVNYKYVVLVGCRFTNEERCALLLRTSVFGVVGPSTCIRVKGMQY